MTARRGDAWSVRRPLYIGAASVLLLLGGFGTWATLSKISGAIVAEGRIEVDQNRQVVQHPHGGVVAVLGVDEGDFVTAGDVLLRLDPTELRSQLAITESQLFELMARRGRLEAERDETAAISFDPLLQKVAAANADVSGLLSGQARLLEARSYTTQQEITQLEKQKRQIADQIRGLTAQRIALDEQLELIEQELGNQQALLDQGLAQATRVLSLQRERARLSGQMGDLAARVAQAEGRMTEIDIEVLQLASSRREEAIATLRDQQYRELELLEERRALIEQLERLDIRAPVSGIVYDLQVFALRSVVRPADPILYIVPQDRPLIINARVEPIHIDKLFLGQEVILRFSALDQRHTPELTGRVTQISADAFQEERTNRSFYRAEIVLSEGEQARLPADVTLIPGMPVEAFIRTQDRTPLAYLIKPLTDYFSKAFRE